MKRIMIVIAITAVMVQFLGTTLAYNSGNCCKIAKQEKNVGMRYLPFFSNI